MYSKLTSISGANAVRYFAGSSMLSALCAVASPPSPVYFKRKANDCKIAPWLFVRLAVVLPFVLRDPKILLHLAHFFEVGPNAVEHLTTFAKNLLDIRMGGIRVGNGLRHVSILSELLYLSIRIAPRRKGAEDRGFPDSWQNSWRTGLNGSSPFPLAFRRSLFSTGRFTLSRLRAQITRENA